MGTALPPTGNQDFNFPPPEQADMLMDLVLDHYIKHHAVVLKKLEHAQSATTQGLQEVKSFVEGMANITHTPHSETPHSEDELQKYDALWDSIISIFRQSGISEDELTQIEQILLTTPKIIRKYYEVLTEQDKALQRLIEELNAPAYEQAMKVVSRVQAHPNPMTMLTPDEYDDYEPAESSKVQAFKIIPNIHKSH